MFQFFLLFLSLNEVNLRNITTSESTRYGTADLHLDSIVFVLSLLGFCMLSVIAQTMSENL